MINLFHDPTMAKVYVATAIAGSAAFSFIIMSAFARADAEREAIAQNIAWSESLSEGAQSEDDSEDDKIELTFRERGQRVKTRAARRAATIAAIIAICFWYGYSNLRIIKAWGAGQEALSAGRQKEAESRFRAAIDMDPAINHSHFLLAKAQMADGKQEPAIAELRLGVRGSHVDPSALVMLGDLLQSTGRTAEAAPAYERAIAIDGKSATTYVRLGSCLYKLGRVQDAINELKFAINLDPKSVEAHAILGMVLLNRGEIARGIMYVKKATEIDPQDVAARNQLAAAYFANKMFTEAASELRTELSISPEFAIGYFNLGRALESSGDLDGALAAYRSYVRAAAFHREYAVAVEDAMTRIDKLTLLISQKPGARKKR